MVREDIFALLISAIPFDELGEAVNHANNTPYGFSAIVFIDNIGKAQRASNALQAGTARMTHLSRPLPVTTGDFDSPSDRKFETGYPLTSANM